jgi:hypothetical protein
MLSISYLDFGKVLIDIEPRLSGEAFHALGARPSFTVGELGYQKHNAYQAIETGAISPAEFRQAFASIFGTPHWTPA